MSRYVVGIDLGTTNSALAYADTREATPEAPAPIRALAIPQVVGLNDVGERPVLPSFLYLPAAREFPAGATDLLVSYTYRIAFQDSGQHYALACAISTIIFVIVAILAVVNLRLFKVRGDQES